jgi:hypothetical protein
VFVRKVFQGFSKINPVPKNQTQPRTRTSHSNWPNWATTQHWYLTGLTSSNQETQNIMPFSRLTFAENFSQHEKFDKDSN